MTNMPVDDRVQRLESALQEVRASVLRLLMTREAKRLREDVLAAIDAALAETPETAPTCAWTVDDYDIWDTACGHRWEFMYDGPKENDCTWCPFCGARITETPEETR